MIDTNKISEVHSFRATFLSIKKLIVVPDSNIHPIHSSLGKL